MGVTLYVFRSWEVGDVDPPAGAFLGSPSSCSALTVAEQLLIRRYRSGMSISAFARRARVSRFWVQQVENGEANPKRLVDFWSNGGSEAGA